VTLSSSRDNENIGGIAKTQADSSTFDADQARLALANHSDFAPLANSQFRQPLHLARFSAHLHDGAVAFRLQIFDWEGNRVSNHGTTDWKNFELMKPYRFRKLISTTIRQLFDSASKAMFVETQFQQPTTNEIYSLQSHMKSEVSTYFF